MVTGGAMRIGAEICRHLHEHGFDIIVHYHTSMAAAGELAASLNNRRADSAWSVRADLGQTDFAALASECAGFNGRLDVLVNNASAFIPTPLATLDKSDWQTLIDVNLRAPLFLAQATRQWLQARRGNIINICDIYASLPLEDYSVYCMTRSALAAQTRLLARELAPEIRVNAIAPGAILWPEGSSETYQQSILNRIPLGRTGTVLDIARSVSFLVEQGHYLTGQVINIDGGRLLRK